MQMAFDLLDFMATLMPKPKVNLTRFQGVFAYNSQYRKIITSECKAKKSRILKTKGPETEKTKNNDMETKIKAYFQYRHQNV